MPETKTNRATAPVPTTSGSRYLQQLCKHWSHNLAVEFTPDHGTVVFPKDARGADHPGDARVTFDARADTLDVTIEATSPAQLEGLKGAGRPPPRSLRLSRSAAAVRLALTSAHYKSSRLN